MSKEKVIYCQKYKKPYPEVQTDIPRSVRGAKVESIELVEKGMVVIDGREHVYSTVRIIHPQVKTDE